MPIYDFICPKCNKTIEVLQSYYADPPICCGEPMKRGTGGITYYQMKGDRQGSTPGIRKRSDELQKRGRELLEKNSNPSFT